MKDKQIKRIISLDIARIFAILAVIMIHCSTNFVVKYGINTEEFLWGNIFDSVSRIGVPLFLMISGALFLDENKEITLRTILFKYVKKIIIITALWEIIYAFVYKVLIPLVNNNPISIKGIILTLIDGHYHMWFLYMIIGIYIVTPFFKKIVCKENKGLVLFFILFSFSIQFLIPTINYIIAKCYKWKYLLEWVNKFRLDFFDGYIAYFLVGWYIVHVGIKTKWIKKAVYALGIISLVGMIIYVHFTGDYNIAYVNMGVPVFIYSVSVFLFVNDIKINVKEKTAKVLVDISNLVFSVYLVHAFVLDGFMKFFVYAGNPLLYILLEFLFVVFVSYIVSYVISKIPLVKKIIKM